MHPVLILLSLGFSVCQEINPIQANVLINQNFYSLTLNQNLLFAVGYTPLEVYQVNLTTNQLLNYEYIGTYYSVSAFHAFRTYADALFIGATKNNVNYLLKLPTNNLQSFQAITYPNTIYVFEYLNAKLYVGTSIGLDVYDANNFTKLETHAIGLTSALLINQQSLFTACSTVQQRNINNLSQIYANYTGENTGYISTLVVKDNFLFFGGNDDGKIFQYNTDTSQFIRTFWNHTNQVVGLAVSGDFMFSGSFDHFWIQWRISTGEIIRKVNAGSAINDLLVDGSFLLEATWYGIYQYKIPELDNSTKIDVEVSTNSNNQEILNSTMTSSTGAPATTSYKSSSSLQTSSTSSSGQAQQTINNNQTNGTDKIKTSFATSISDSFGLLSFIGFSMLLVI